MSFDGKGVLDISISNNRRQASGTLQMESRVHFRGCYWQDIEADEYISRGKIVTRVEQGQARW